ncbi:MAG: YwaF family protein [Gemmatimonadaceae bacterium]
MGRGLRTVLGSIVPAPPALRLRGASGSGRVRESQALVALRCLLLGPGALHAGPPDSRRGRRPGSLGFIAFFLYHAFVVGAGVYVVAVHGFRPSGRDLVVAIALGMAWAAATFALDLVTGWNYGYLGRNTPGRPTLIDYLGPWPQRALLMVMLGAGAMVLLWLPWLLFRRGRPRPT